MDTGNSEIFVNGKRSNTFILHVENKFSTLYEQKYAESRKINRKFSK